MPSLPLVEAIASTSRLARASSRKAPTANSRRGPRMVLTPEQQSGKNEIEHQHQQRGVDHRTRGGNRGALDGRLGVVADVGGDQRRGTAEHRRLDEGDAEILAEID